MAGIIDLIGNTPMAEIKRLNPNPNVRIFAKLEGNNPGGSVKDRAALNMIRSAIERGDIKKGTRLVEATSGNTGIALAMIASLYGLEIEFEGITSSIFRPYKFAIIARAIPVFPLVASTNRVPFFMSPRSMALLIIFRAALSFT